MKPQTKMQIPTQQTNIMSFQITSNKNVNLHFQDYLVNRLTINRRQETFGSKKVAHSLDAHHCCADALFDSLFCTLLLLLADEDTGLHYYVCEQI